jgi:polyisoprenoid-binding protein YceI
MPRYLCIRLLLALGLSAVPLRAQEMTLELDPANTRIDFTLAATLHTVHGSFALKSGTIHFNPQTGSASGLVLVDATSASSGSDGRDHKMHKDVLESQRYPEISFTPTKFSGKFEGQGESNVSIEGVFRLHGAEHPIVLILPAQATGNTVSAKVHVVIPYVAWGLKNPSTFLLHVGDTVEVDITSTGRLLPQRMQPAASH